MRERGAVTAPRLSRASRLLVGCPAQVDPVDRCGAALIDEGEALGEVDVVEARTQPGVGDAVELGVPVRVEVVDAVLAQNAARMSEKCGARYSPSGSEKDRPM